MKFISQTYNQLTLIKAPKVHTDLLWDLSILFVGLAVVYFIFIFFYRSHLTKRSWQVRERKSELSPMISEFLFYEEKASKDEQSNYIKLKIEIRQLLKDSFNRKVLSEVLLDLQKDISGDTQKQLFKLYQDLGFHNDDFKRLKSWRWEIISNAILNLTRMQVSEAYIFIAKFINDKRATIRKQAEIGMVSLKPEGISYFLDTTKYRISEWQQLKLIDVLRTNSDFQPPRFKAWLTSSNRHVVLFALRLMKFYNQNDADAALIELVKHKNNQIKEEAIACIIEFHVVKALPVLKLVFWKSSIDIKIAILSAIAVLGSQADLEFLRLIEKKEANFSVLSKAHSSINAISPDSIMPSKGLVNIAKYTIPEDIRIDIKQDKSLKEAEITSFSETVISNEINEQEVEKDDSHGQVLDVQEADSSENEILDYSFLPLVVDSDLEIETNTTDDIETNLNSIEVYFEELTAHEEKASDTRKLSFEITEEEIAFLPIVTDIEEKLEEEKTIHTQNDLVIAVDEIEVVCSEVPSMPETTTPSSSLDYALYNTTKILNTKVIYNEVIVNKIDNPLLESENELAEIPFEQTAPSSLEELFNIPEAMLSDDIFVEKITNKENSEESKMRLFDDITEFGDEREVPLLKELLIAEKQQIVKNRIEILIAKFSENLQKPKTPFFVKQFNIFEDLFRTSDTEAKLILLNEIVAVGDEAEIEFLEGLLDCDTKAIRNKAAQTLEELRIKLAKEKNLVASDSKTSSTDESKTDKTALEYDALISELQIAPPQTDEIFDLNFELTESLEKVDEEIENTKQGNQESFFGQLATFSNKIIDKLNG